MWFRRTKMTVELVSTCPATPCVHIDFDASHPLAGARGALLCLAVPEEIVDAVGRSRRGCDWCVWGLEMMPGGERRAAAFVVAVARAARAATVYVVLPASSARAGRIAGHLVRSGCVTAQWSVTVPQRQESDERHDFT